MQYDYIIKPLAVRKVRSFYRNVSMKYPNIYSYEDMLRYHDACHALNMK